MPFGPDNPVFQSFYHTLIENKRQEQNEKKLNEKNRKILDHIRIPNGKSRSDMVAVIIGIFFVSAVAMFALYIGYSDAPNKIIVTELSDKVMMHDEPRGLNIKQVNYMKPLGYVLYMNPVYENKTYNGLVRVNFKCLKNTNIVVLDSVNHNVSKIAIQTITKTDIIQIKVKNVTPNSKEQTVTIEFDKELRKDYEYQMFVGFNGELTNRTENGLYYIDYTSADIIGEFRDGTAKKVFPCFDNRNYHVTFELIVQHHETWRAISNMPLTKMASPEKPRRKESFFKVDPSMTTDNVLFIITKKDISQVNITENLTANIYFPNGYESQTDEFRNMLPRYLKSYESTNSRKLSKLDIVPVAKLNKAVKSSDGIALVREKDIFFDNVSGTAKQLEIIATTMAYSTLTQLIPSEVRHCECSTNIEALKILFSYRDVQKLYSKWDMNSALYLELMYKVMNNDYSIDISNVAKVAAIYQMLIDYVDDSDALMKSLKEKILAEQPDFGRCNMCKQIDMIMAQAIKNVDYVNFFNQWANQAGYPLLSVNASNMNLYFMQEKFSASSGTASTKIQTFWQILINTYCQAKTQEKVLIPAKSRYMYPNPCKIDNKLWYLVSPGGSSYWRVNYDEKNWANILRQFNENHTVFTPNERAKILSDIFSLAYVGRQSLATALQFTKYLEYEEHYMPYQVALNELNKIKSIYASTEIRGCIERYVSRQIIERFSLLNKDNDKLEHLDQILYSTLLELTLKSKKTEYHTLHLELENYFMKWLLTKESMKIPGPLKYAAVQYGVMQSTQKEWDALVKFYNNTYLELDSDMILKALSVTNNKTLFKRYMSFTSPSDKTISNYDKMKVLKYACLNPLIQTEYWDVITSSLEYLYTINEDYIEEYNELLQNCLYTLHTNTFLKKVKVWAESTNHDVMRSLLDGVMEKIEVNIQLRRRWQELVQWFNIEDPYCITKLK